MKENKQNKEPSNKNNKVPRLRFQKYIDESLKQSKLKMVCTFSKGSGLTKEDLNDTGYPCILYGELYTKYSGKIVKVLSKTKNIPRSPKYSKKGDVILPLSGETPLDISNSAVVSDPNILLGGDMLVITPQHSIDSLFLSYYLSNCKKREIAKKACGISIIHSHRSDIEKLQINYPSMNEQKEIASLFSFISQKEIIIKSKIDILKNYKKGLSRLATNVVINNGKEMLFNILFKEKAVKNDKNLPQYTVGKYGLKLINENNYSTAGHKIFNDEDLIIGIGIEEIGISLHSNGSVSPIYDVYKITDKKYFDSIRYTFKSQIWRRRNFITRKSTRREFEVDKNALKKMKIKALDKGNFYSYSMPMHYLEALEESLNLQLRDLLKTKKYLLAALFI